VSADVSIASTGAAVVSKFGPALDTTLARVDRIAMCLGRVEIRAGARHVPPSCRSDRQIPSTCRKNARKSTFLAVVSIRSTRRTDLSILEPGFDTSLNPVHGIDIFM